MTDQNDLDKKRADAVEALHNTVREQVDSGLKPFAEAHEEIRAGMKAIEERFERMETMQRSVDVPGASDAFASGELSLGRVCLSLEARKKGDSNWRAFAPGEWEVSDQARAGDPSMTPDSSGGFLIPNQLHTDLFVKPFEDYLIPATMGARVITGLTGGAQSIPRLDSILDADTPAEHEAATKKELDLGELKVEPRVAQATMEPSRQFLRAGVGATELISQLIGEAIPRKISKMAFSGTGAAGQPVGILNAPGVQSVDFAGISGPYSPEVYYKLSEMEGKLEDIDALQFAGTAGWAMQSRAKRAFRGMKSENAVAGTPSAEMARKSVYDAAAREILGYQFRTTGGGLTGGAQTDVILGDWSQMGIFYWGGLMLEATDKTHKAVTQREVLISAYQEYDIGLFRPSSFCVAKNFDTTGL